MPIPTNLLSIVATAVDGMAPPTYNFAYGPVDVEDPAAWPAGSPQVYLDSPSKNSGATVREMVGKTTNAQLLTFRVIVPKGAGNAMKAIDNALRAAGMMLSYFQGSTNAYRLVTAYPGEISIRFLLTWRQSRENPESL